MTKQPQLSFWQIWNMCFGFMGIQFGFALQNANVSRIFQTLGADYNNMTLLWVAAPITGLIVQPIVGYFSDRTGERSDVVAPIFSTVHYCPLPRCLSCPTPQAYGSPQAPCGY